MATYTLTRHSTQRHHESACDNPGSQWALDGATHLSQFCDPFASFFITPCEEAFTGFTFSVNAPLPISLAASSASTYQQRQKSALSLHSMPADQFGALLSYTATLCWCRMRTGCLGFSWRWLLYLGFSWGWAGWLLQWRYGLCALALRRLELQ